MPAAGVRRRPATTSPGRLASLSGPSADRRRRPKRMHMHPRHAAVDKGNSGDAVRAGVAPARAMRLNDRILRRWETIAFGSGNSSRLSRDAAAADQDSIGR
ncbi:hypothetical protein XH87_34870 [Bradyrhizobium sp. CCBAU 53415]|nr:hypothetical protein [Bradyrhizobium sp. CCBAU 53415]